MAIYGVSFIIFYILILKNF